MEMQHNKSSSRMNTSMYKSISVCFVFLTRGISHRGEGATDSDYSISYLLKSKLYPITYKSHKHVYLASNASNSITLN